MITESYHEHKDYTIRLRAATNNGFWYKISKMHPNGIKRIYLRERGWSFISADNLVQKAKDYIDNHNSQLEEKYNKIISND